MSGDLKIRTVILMKSYEIRKVFEDIRNKRKKRRQIDIRMIAAVQIIILACIGVSYLFDLAMTAFFPGIKIPPVLEMIIISLIVGAGATIIVSKIFYSPFKKLRKAIERVADGDLTVRLEPESSYMKEIQEIYSGFNLMVHELSATEILQTDFVSNVSHEFKTPINAIEGYATLLQDFENMSKQEQDECIEKILFNTRRLSGLVGNILLLSKIDNQSIDSGKKKYRLDEQIRRAILMFETEWVKKDIEFDVEMEDTEFFGNENLLHHVWYNLIGNAIKFSPDGGTVCIRLYEEDGKTVFEITDEGAGLSEEAQKHMFDKFYQGDSSHKQEGNGLGLALVKKIIDVTDGEISAGNLPVKGCRFTVKL